MVSLLDVKGQEKGAKYKIIQLDEKKFMITVSKGKFVKTSIYDCEYPATFELHEVDRNNLDQLLGETIELMDRFVENN